MATYTKQDIAKALETTIRTITEDNQYLTNEGYISPMKVSGQANQYSEDDLEIFRQLREHCQAGYARKSFIPIKNTEIITIGDNKLKLVSENEEISTVENFRQIFEHFSSTDLFYDYKQLQRCADNQWYLPTAKLAAIINKKPATFSKFKIFLHQGFRLTRLPQKEGSSYIWSVNSNREICRESEKQYSSQQQ